MQPITRLATPRFRRITFRISGIEIELRTRVPMVQERPSREERAFRREKAEAMLRCEREYLMARRALGL